MMIWFRTIRNYKSQIKRIILSFNNLKTNSQEWIMTPAELYGCLCHKPNSH